MIDIDVFSRGNDQIGEGPLWSVAEQALYWIDIGRQCVLKRKSSDSRSQSWILHEYPGCLAEFMIGRMVIAMGEGLHQLDINSGVIEPMRSVPAFRPGTRFNDGKVDPRGRLWVGTMQNNLGPKGEEVLIERLDGCLYRFDSEGRVEILEEAIGIANTLAWSPDLTRFYFGDSLKNALFMYDYDPDSGTIADKRTFYVEPGLGVADGSAIDVDGCLWNARWDGGAVIKITPQGTLDQIVELPLPRPTSCCFGGPDLKTLFVTSAANGLTAKQLERFPLSGSVISIDGAGQGLPVPPLTVI